MNKELLRKYLNNRCSETELGEVLSWMNTDALNEKSKTWMVEDWNSFHEPVSLDEDEKFTVLFDKIQERIGSNNQKYNSKEGRALTLPVVVTWVTRVAAILLLPVLTFLFYTLSEKNNLSDKYTNLVVDSLEVIAPMGSRTVVQLSDGSEVHLNYGSKIKYPQFFSGGTRDVTLTGEGFFKVAHNPEKPFVVKAGNLNIKAVGTTFDVLAYPGDDVIETTLVDGKLVLEQPGQIGKDQTIGTLVPGQHVAYTLLNGNISSTKGKVEKYISWIDGKLIFEDTPMFQVTERLSRMFNVDFQVKDEVRDYTYTVILEDESLSQILDLMTIATPVVCKALPRHKLLDGTYSKQRIIIERRK